jgi:hypothetical protein
VVTIPIGEDTQEAQQLPQNDDHDNDHEEEENNEEEEEEGNKVEGEDDEDYTPLSVTEKDETFHDAKTDETFCDTDEIKTVGNEALIPTGRLRGLLNHLNITTQLEFRIKRVLLSRWEEYKAIMEIFSGPNVLSHHKGPTFRATYQDAVADAAW